MSRVTRIVLAFLLLAGLGALSMAVTVALRGRSEITNITQTIEEMGLITILGAVAAVLLLAAWGIFIASLAPRARKRSAVATLVAVAALAGWFGVTIVWQIATNLAETEASPRKPVTAAEIEQRLNTIAASIPRRVVETPCRDEAIWIATPKDQKTSWFGQEMVWALAVSDSFLTRFDPNDDNTHPNVRRAFGKDNADYFRRSLHDWRYLAVVRPDAIFIVDTDKASVVCQVPVWNNDVRRSMRRISHVVRVSL